jgi:hypothetical protein
VVAVGVVAIVRHPKVAAMADPALSLSGIIDRMKVTAYFAKCQEKHQLPHIPPNFF